MHDHVTPNGGPRRPGDFEYIRSYSLYDNVERKDYPHILAVTSLNDSAVQYWEPMKWTAKLRAMKTDDNCVLLKTNMGAGHGGASGGTTASKKTPSNMRLSWIASALMHRRCGSAQGVTPP